MPMFELVQEMMFVNTCVKFCHNQLRNELCRAVTPSGQVRTNVRTGRSLFTMRGYNNNNSRLNKYYYNGDRLGRSDHP